MNFKSFQKLGRLSRDCVITEKIDGTNAQIFINQFYPKGEDSAFDAVPWITQVDDVVIAAGSRTRYITPSNDNFGFAGWVEDNAQELSRLGLGRHYGEWWGSGIQRTYGLTQGDKRFSLFNVALWGNPKVRPSCCSIVPILKTGIFCDQTINDALAILKQEGSQAVPGYMNPEGIVIYHTTNGSLFKKTIENDEKPKGQVI